MKIINYIGFKSGSLIGKSLHSRVNRNVLWEFECSSCGNSSIYSAAAIRATNRKKELACEHCGHRKAYHGYTGTPIHRAWMNMLARCSNKNHPHWLNYGGRGITVCARWLTFLNFLEDVGEPPFAGASLDRINNNDGYKKSNCRWATMVQQANNQRPKKNTVWVLLDGSPVTLSHAARAVGKRLSSLQRQYKKGIREFTASGSRNHTL